MTVSESYVLGGAVVSCIGLFVIFLSVSFISISLIKRNALSDIEISETSSMVQRRSGKNILRLQCLALLSFCAPLISYFTLRTNIFSTPSSSIVRFDCKMSWFLEYFGYEIGKLLIAILLIYRLYSTFDNSMYHIPKKYITVTFFIVLPFIIFMYSALAIYVSSFINASDLFFTFLSTQNGQYFYCEYNTNTLIYQLSQMASLFRDISLNFALCYQFIARLHAMNVHAKQFVTGKRDKVATMETDEIDEEQTKTKTNAKGKTKTKGKGKTNVKSKGKMKTKEKAKGKGVSRSSSKRGKLPIPPVVLQVDSVEEDSESEYEECYYGTQSEHEQTEETLPRFSTTQRLSMMANDIRFNMQNRRDLIIKYVILIVVMFNSSFLAQIVCYAVGFDSFVIAIDICVHCVCSMLLLWISNGIWNGMVKVCYKVCQCQKCCPVLMKSVDVV